MSQPSKAELEHNAIDNFCIEVAEHLHKGGCKKCVPLGNCILCSSFQEWLDENSPQ